MQSDISLEYNPLLNFEDNRDPSFSNLDNVELEGFENIPLSSPAVTLSSSLSSLNNNGSSFTTLFQQSKKQSYQNTSNSPMMTPPPFYSPVNHQSIRKKRKHQNTQPSPLPPVVLSPRSTRITTTHFPAKEQPNPEIFYKQVEGVDNEDTYNTPFMHYSNSNEDKMTIEEKLEQSASTSNSKLLELKPVVIDKIRPMNPRLKNAFTFPFVQHIMQVPASDALDIMSISHLQFKRDQVECVTRAYEADFYREKVGDERACVNGDMCIARIIPSAKGKGLTLREFYCPSQWSKVQESKHWPTDIQECILCSLHAINKMYINTKADQMGIDIDTSISPFYYPAGEPGEYCIEHCIATTENKFNGLWGPVPALKLFNYEFAVFRVPTKKGDVEAKGFRVVLPTANGPTNFFRLGSLASKTLEKFTRL